MRSNMDGVGGGGGDVYGWVDKQLINPGGGLLGSLDYCRQHPPYGTTE